MTVTVPMRAALGFAATLYASFLAIEARAEDASPWQRDGHSAVRLLAGARSGAVLLGGIAVQLQPGWKTYVLTQREAVESPCWCRRLRNATIAQASTPWVTTTRSCCPCEVPWKTRRRGEARHAASE